MKIIVDAMGGDNAPLEIVRGALAANRDQGAQVVLVGRTADILRAVEECGEKTLPAGLEIRDASEVVEMTDDPATAFKRKKDSSLTVGLTMLRDGEGDAFVSAGSTGALLAGATLVVKRIRGIRRAAMSPMLPTATGHMVLCDCGANAECTAEYLLQFAYLGSFYAMRVMGVERPKVALLNIGTESEKGTALQREAYEALTAAAQAGRIHFVGNIEASAAMLGEADVVVCDGFSGNIMLKTIEGTAKLLSGKLKELFLKSGKNKAAALLVKNDFRAFKSLLDPNRVGGTPLLGISKPVLKAHGSSNGLAIQNAILQAMAFSASGFTAEIEKNIEYMRVDRQEG